jgi:hypothetical protein
MLAFAQDLADRFARLVDQPDLEEGDASRGFGLLKFDGETGDPEFVYLDCEPAAQAVGDQRRGVLLTAVHSEWRDGIRYENDLNCVVRISVPQALWVPGSNYLTE